MSQVDISQYQSFGEISDRLDELVGQVRDKDVSLEHSLDLFDEAIALGSKAIGLVDATDFSPEEEARLSQEEPAKASDSNLSEELDNQVSEDARAQAPSA